MQVLGIDFGSLHCKAALQDETKKMPSIVRNNLSNENTPTILCCPQGEQRLTGEQAGNKERIRPQITCAVVKELLGRTVDDPAVAAAKLTGCPISADGMISLRADAPMSPEQVAAVILRTIIAFAQPAPNKIRVSAPTHFTGKQRAALVAAGRILGYADDAFTVVDESVAAAVFFHHTHFGSLAPTLEESPKDAVVIVINAGHSSTSAVAFQASQQEVRVLSTQSLHLGSSDIERKVAGLVVDHVKAKNKHDLSNHAKSLNRIIKEARKAKEMLGTTEKAVVQLESLENDIDVHFPITRDALEGCSAEYLSAVKTLATNLLEDARKALGIDAVTLRVEVIGAAWRLPSVQAALKSTLGVDVLGVSLDSNLSTAQGCAIYGVLAAAAPEGAPEGRDACHNVVLSGAVPPENVDAVDEALVAKWIAEETALFEEDEKHRDRLRAYNAYEAYVLSTKMEAQVAIADNTSRQGLVASLDAAEEWLMNDGYSAGAAEIDAKLAEVKEGVAKDYPQMEAHYAMKREELAKKDKELEEQAKLQAADKELKSDPQRLRVAQERREQGQSLFKQEHHEEALTRFVQALGILGQIYDTSNEEYKKKKDEIALSCHLNIASLSVKIGKWRNAVNNATSALEFSPNNAKAYFRRGQARSQLHEYGDAEKDLNKALEIAGADAGIQAELDALKARVAAEKAKEKKMFSKMFS